MHDVSLARSQPTQLSVTGRPQTLVPEEGGWGGRWAPPALLSVWVSTSAVFAPPPLLLLHGGSAWPVRGVPQPRRTSVAGISL